MYNNDCHIDILRHWDNLSPRSISPAANWPGNRVQKQQRNVWRMNNFETEISLYQFFKAKMWKWFMMNCFIEKATVEKFRLILRISRVYLMVFCQQFCIQKYKA